eukprot:10421924-Alexandrium_andersonii.AAC.1
MHERCHERCAQVPNRARAPSAPQDRRQCATAEANPAIATNPWKIEVVDERAGARTIRKRPKGMHKRCPVDSALPLA